MPQGNPNYPRRPAPKYGTWPTGDPRRRLLRKPYDGGAVPAPPVVLTLGVNAINATSANVVGSVNPDGSSTNWWISYSTVPQLPDVSSAPVSIGSGTTPITITYQLGGLTTGTTYYVAVVGQSTAGTVYGQTISFIAQALPIPAIPATTPFGTPSVTIPHFNVPFRIVTTAVQSGAVVVEQDTLEEVLANVTTVVLCPVGACSQLPGFGRPDLTFAQEPVATDELVTTIQNYEPRATEDVVSQLMPDGETWGITLATSTVGAAGL